MANQKRVKFLGMLSQSLATISGIDYKIDYTVFKVSKSISTYPIFFERPWLYLTKAKDDWDKRILTVGKGVNKTFYPCTLPNTMEKPKKKILKLPLVIHIDQRVNLQK
jgi:hypothetical protein